MHFVFCKKKLLNTAFKAPQNQSHALTLVNTCHPCLDFAFFLSQIVSSGSTSERSAAQSQPLFADLVVFNQLVFR